MTNLSEPSKLFRTTRPAPRKIVHLQADGETGYTHTICGLQWHMEGFWSVPAVCRDETSVNCDECNQAMSARNAKKNRGKKYCI